MLPSEFDHWPAAGRALWTAICASPAWRTKGWAHLTLRQLAAVLVGVLGRDCCLATVRRWLAWLGERGEIERRCVPQGAALPDGSVTWCDHWILMPGTAMQTRAAGELEGGGNTAPVVAPVVTPPLHHAGSHPPLTPVAKRVSREEIRPSGKRRRGEPPALTAAFKDSRLLSSLSGSRSRSGSDPSKLRSKLGGETNEADKEATLPAPTRRLTERLLRHYAEASGIRVKHFRAASRAAVATSLETMDGEDAAKEMRLRAVIDDAIAESRARGMAHPSLRFVFHPKHVRRRLERLAEAEHLAQKTAEAGGADMFAEGFDRAVAEARAQVEAGATPTALERARPFVENHLVTDRARIAAYRALVAPARARATPPLPRSWAPLAKAPGASPRPAQDGPPRVPLGRTVVPSRSARFGGVSGPEDALRALAALFGSVTEPPPLPAAPVTPLSDDERAELEAAQTHARARWARAG